MVELCYSFLHDLGQLSPNCTILKSSAEEILNFNFHRFSNILLGIWDMQFLFLNKEHMVEY